MSNLTPIPLVSGIPVGPLLVPQAFAVGTTQVAVPGASAYTVALANGFVGTEQEWLDQLSATGAIETHLDDTAPHQAALSTKNIAAWLDAMTQT